MQYGQAEQIAQSIRDIWPRGLRMETWRTVLEQDYSSPERARKTVQDLKRTLAHSPAIADFHARYLSLRVGTLADLVDCHECSSTGWIEAPEYERNGERYSAVQPCLADDCEHGKQAARTNGRIASHRVPVAAE